ncbi:MAG TPA: metallophosphoesterase [Longimicrobium sp.]
MPKRMGMRGTRRAAAAALACAAALLMAGCFRTKIGIGRVSPHVSPTDTLELRLVLIGDAGLPAPGGEPVMRGLHEELSRDPKHSFVVFLGDNVYPRGMVLDSTAAERRENERIINAQLEPLLATGVKGIMIPGNHDWATGTAGGLEAVRTEGRYVKSRGRGLVEFLPEDGCPGPVVRDFGNYLRLIVLDTQWWLQEGSPRPEGPSSECRAKTEAEVIDSLAADLASAGPRRVVVVSHHPIVSGGQHGGYFDWPTYLFPFHPWARQSGLFAKQDVTGREYRELIAGLSRAYRPHPPLVHAAGHEHNLQLLQPRGAPVKYLVVSGAGIYDHTTPTRVIAGTMYARSVSGWVTLAFLRDGRVRMAYRVVDETGSFKEDYSIWLDVPPLIPVSEGSPTTPHEAQPSGPTRPATPADSPVPPPAPAPPPAAPPVAPAPAPRPAPPPPPPPTPAGAHR